MKRFIVVILHLVWLTPAVAQVKDALPVSANPNRFLAASPNVESFRPVGESRTWVFYSRQTVFGHVTSLVADKREIGGQNAQVFQESLQIDFTKLGQESRIFFVGESYFTPEGYFSGCDFRMGPKDSAEQLVLVPEGNRLTGFYTNLGSRNDVDQPWTRGTFFWDTYLVDQLEVYLALHDLKMGVRFDDSLFMPQSLTYAHIKGQVDWFMWQEIYKGKIDSVFVIQLTEPSSCQLFFTSDKKLVKVDLQDQEIRIYQDVVRQVAPAAAKKADRPAAQQAPPAPTTPPFSLRALLFKLPHYFAFLIMAAVTVLIFAHRAFKWSSAYLSLGLGMVLYVAMPLIVFPVLIVVARDWLQIGSAAGSAFYVRGATFALVSGLVQAVLLLAGIVSVGRITKSLDYRTVGLAAFLSAGFALADSFYLSGFQITILFDWPLLERGSMMALYIAAGVLVGRFLKEEIALTVWAVLGASGAIGVARFCPMLVQGKIVELQAMYFLLAFWAAAFLVLVLFLSRRDYGRINEDEASETNALQP
jgi:hypothetical protein